ITVRSGLVSRWSFDADKVDLAGLTATDDIGGKTLTLAGTQTKIAGKVAGAVNQAGSATNFMNVALTGTFTDFSLCGWINPTSGACLFGFPTRDGLGGPD